MTRIAVVCLLAVSACGAPSVTAARRSAPPYRDLPEPASTTTTTTVVPVTRAAVRHPSRARRTTVATAARTGGCEAWRATVERYPWPVDTALRVMKCESGCRPDARNPRSTATGLYQILNGPLAAEANIAQAAAMHARRGWQPWNASRGCWG